MLVLPATMLAVRHFRLVVIRLAGLSRLGITWLGRLTRLRRLRRPFLGLHGDRALGGGRVAGLVRNRVRQHVLSRFRRVHRAGHLDGIGHVTIHIVRGRHAGQRLELGILFHRHVIHAGEHRRGRVGGRNRLLLIQRSIKTSNDTPLYRNMSTHKTEEHHLPGNDVAGERRRHQLRHARSAQHNRHMQS